MTALRVAALILLTGCQQPETVPNGQQTRIDWDRWGVPHIFAASSEDFFFADGWAQMHAHANTLLRLYGTSRGRAAEYWGEEYLQNDHLVHTLGHPHQAASMWQRQDPELRQYIAAFAAGINAYARARPAAIDEDNRVVLPVTVEDVNLHTLFVVNSRFIAGRELMQSLDYGQTGSNAIAIGPSRSESGNAMLVQNPHLPWHGEFLFFEKQLVTADRNITGTHIVGFPGFAIAFNDRLGWTHTNNTIDNADLYELELTGKGYRYDGGEREFGRRSVSLRVLQQDGSHRTEKLEILSSEHGPVIAATEEQALALRLVGDDAQDSLLQWWRMANAHEFGEFESALRMAQIPFWNVMYADAEGNIFYLFNGHVPIRSHGGWDDWQAPVDGGDPANNWTGIHGHDELPRLQNPETGWLQNANDPPWTSTLPAMLNAGDYPAYMSPRGMDFRPQRAAQMILEDDLISFEELVAIKHDTRMEMADRLLDDLFEAVASHGNETAGEAAAVLRNWDRRADSRSRGAVLFMHFALGFQDEGPGVYSRPWDETRPVETPDGFSDPAAMAELLATVARDVKDLYGSLDIPWGDVNRLRYNGRDLPANGSLGQLGVFRVAAALPIGEATQSVTGGDSWVGVIEFGETPRAKVLLSYGNSTQPGSPHFGDQLQLFSENRLRDAWRTEEQLRGNIVRTEFFQDGRFYEMSP